ncbi:MAG: lipid-A-disaccharide synthase [Rhodobacteraceae bacterium]|nr:lipid-A-disaccharide synthase [Paracoccaceae bacterium]
MSPRLFLLAGEPSGDRLGAALIAGLRALAPRVEVAGVGGPAMEAEGLRSLFPMSDLSVMGLAEVLPRYPRLLRRLSQAARSVAMMRPDALVTIDSPDFSLRLAGRARLTRPSLRTIHYVAPSVWAWRPGRAARMAKVVDHVLALLPFEPPYMEAAGMTCDFVGHPVVAEPQATPAEAAAFRDGHGIAPDAPVVLALPGSREAEVSRLGERFGETLRLVQAAHPDLRVLVPAVAHLADRVAALARGWPGRPVVIDARADPGGAAKRAAFRAADAALAASGTVSLELAAAGVPMVIGYDMAPLTWAVMRRLARIDTVTLVNLVTQTRAVPEFLGPACRPGPMAGALLALLDDPAARATQAHALDRAMERLGRGGEAPGLRAARSVLAHLR